GFSASAMTTTCTSAVAGSETTATPDAVSAAATVPRPTPSRPSTATRSGAAIRSMILTNLGLWFCSANRVSASTKICWPSVDPAQVKPGPRGACWPKCWHLDGYMANGCPQYQSKATVEYQSVPRCGYQSVHE